MELAARGFNTHRHSFSYNPHYYLALAYSRLADEDRALAEMQSLLEDGIPGGFQPRKGSSWRYFTGKLAQRLNQAVNKTGSSSAYFARGNLNMINENYRQAVADFSAVIARRPKWADAYQCRAEAFDSLDLPEQSQADKAKFLALAPNADNFADQACEYMGKQQFSKAIKEFDRVLKMDPWCFGALEWRGYIRYFVQGDSKGAIEDWSKALLLNPAYDKVLEYRGQAYLQQGNEDDAIQDFKEMVSLHAAHARIYYYLGHCFEKKHQFAKALPEFSQAIKLAPSEPGYYQARARTYKAMGNIDAMLADLKNAFELDVAYGGGDVVTAQAVAPAIGSKDHSLTTLEDNSWLIKTLHYEQSNQYSQAIACITEALKKSLSGADVKLILRGDAYCLAKDYQPALADYTTVLLSQGANPMILAKRGLAHFFSLEYKESIEDFDKVIKGGVENGDIYYYRALACDKLHRNEESRESFMKYIEWVMAQNPNSEQTSKLKLARTKLLI